MSSSNGDLKREGLKEDKTHVIEDDSDPDRIRNLKNCNASACKTRKFHELVFNSFGATDFPWELGGD
jgi:hypothetical protein